MKKNQYILQVLLFILLIVNAPLGIFSSMAIEGRIFDQFGQLIPGATVIFTDIQYPDKVYQTTTDENGFYSVSVPELRSPDADRKHPKGVYLFNAYPNPFTSHVLIPFHIEKEGIVELEIIDVSGKLVTTLISGNMQAGYYEIKWDGQKNNGGKATPGAYFVSIRNGAKRDAKCIIYAPEAGVPSPYGVPGAFNPAMETEPIIYQVKVSAVHFETYTINNVSLYKEATKDFYLYRLDPVPFATVGNYIGLIDDQQEYQPFFVNGVNLGVSIPGTHPGQMAASAEQYRAWLNQMGELGFNAIRVYTLHYPAFYEELARYNRQNPSRPILLFHGVWLDEELPQADFYTFTEEFDADIEEVIDAVHGNRFIAERPGRAWGDYTEDVSRWIAGYIIGREVHPYEVIQTNMMNYMHTSFTGQAVALAEGSPTEVWFAARLDKVIMYERTTYGVERPVSMSSWPTLDPLEHPTEQPDSTEDIISVDLSGLQNINAPAGYFASYHAYPYFPDFISEQPEYLVYADEYGPNSYVGYLNNLKSHYQNMPLFIAEYGVPSSWGNAHYAHSGMNHGGQDEQKQGNDNVRLLKNIYNAQCGGGFVFAWIDEWFKNCWITAPMGTGLERRPLWHNVCSAEENFGLIAFDEAEPDFMFFPSASASGQLNKIEADYNSEYFFVKVGLSQPLADGDTMLIAFDTYKAELGESLLPNGTQLDNRAEFYLAVSNNHASLYVTQAYDLFANWFGTSGPEQLYHSIATDGAPWMKVRWKNNHWENAIYPIGDFIVRNNTQPYSSREGLVYYPDYVFIRIPWTLLNFVDPSMLEVMHDDRNTPERETMISDGIAITAVLNSTTIKTPRLEWNQWDIVPPTVERLKASYFIMKEAMEVLDFTPLSQPVSPLLKPLVGSGKAWSLPKAEK